MLSIKLICFKVNNNFRNICTFSKNFNEYKNVKNRENMSEMNRNIKKMNIDLIDGRKQSPQMYCINCVKKYDFENYLSTLVLKDSAIRRKAFAIKALNAELAQIRDLTSTQLMAQIRLQYWSDIIDEIFDSNHSMLLDANQPIAYELQKCEIKAKLSKHWFKKLIESRMDSKSLSAFPFQTLQELETYSESSISAVYYLIVECMAQTYKVSANQRLVLDHISSHLGKAQAFSNVLRGVTHNARHNRCYIPSDLLIKHKTSHEDLLRAKPSPQVFDLCFEMASIAQQNIETALTLIQQIDRQNRLIFLPIISIQNYLKRLQKSDFNLFDPKLSQRNGFLPFLLWYKSKFF